MSQKDLHTQFPELASKYLSGNASDVEVRELEEWVSADPEHKRAFMAFKKAWMLAGVGGQTPAADVEKRWAETSEQLFAGAKVVKLPPNRLRTWMGIAATLALLAVVATVLLLRPWADPTMLAEAVEAPEHLTLKDGSQVVLNRASTLSYAFEKKASIRRVALAGDAFFDVARDASKPFIIETRGLEIEVLGTSFYVDAREDQPQVHVIVESGKVAVRYQDQERILVANEMAVFEVATSELEKQISQDANFQALKTGTLLFENTPLSEVVFALSRHYHVDIAIGADALQDCRLDATFTDKSLEAVLTILESSFDIQATRTGETIVLTGRCADTE